MNRRSNLTTNIINKVHKHMGEAEEPLSKDDVHTLIMREAARATKGDQAAFEEIMQSFASLLVNETWARAKSASDMEDKDDDDEPGFDFSVSGVPAPKRTQFVSTRDKEDKRKFRKIARDKARYGHLMDQDEIIDENFERQQKARHSWKLWFNAIGKACGRNPNAHIARYFDSASKARRRSA